MTKVKPSFLTVLSFLTFLACCNFAVAQKAKEEPSSKYVWKTISGKVVDSDGKPIKDAYVCHDNLNSHSMNHTSTNDKGEFELKYRQAKSYLESGWIWAYSPGHNLRCVMNLRTDDHLIELPKYTEFKITFMQPDGTPLQQADIRPFRYSIPNGVYSADSSTLLGGIMPKLLGEKLTTKTDENGQCLIRNIPRALWGRVIIESEDNGQHILGGHPTVDSYQLAQTGSLKIEILPDEPIEFHGTEVTVHSWGEKGENSLQGKVGGLGVCKFEKVIPGDVRIRLKIGKDEVYQPQIEKSYTVTEGSETHVTIPVKKTVEIKGKVLAGGKPVPFARVMIGEMRRITNANKKGEFKTRVFPSNLSIRVYDIPREFYQDFEVGNTRMRLVKDSDRPVSISPIELSALTSIPVKVIDEDGKPITGYNISSRYKNLRYGAFYTPKLNEKGETIAKFRKRDLDNFNDESFTDEVSVYLLLRDDKGKEKPKEIELSIESKKPFVLRCKRSELDKI